MGSWFSIQDGKSPQLRIDRDVVPFDFADESLEVAFPDGFQQGIQFIRRALDVQFDAAVLQVAHRAGDVVAGGDLFDRVAEAHSLDPSGIKQALGFFHNENLHAQIPILKYIRYMAIHFSDISRMSLFRGFSEGFIQLLDLFFREANYKAGTVMVREGELQQTFYMVVAGEVEVSRRVNGVPMPLDILPAGQYFGEMNLFDPGVATASVTALTPVRTLEISNEKFRAFITHKPELAADFTFQLAETIVKRFRSSTHLLSEELARPENIRGAQQIDRGTPA